MSVCICLFRIICLTHKESFIAALFSFSLSRSIRLQHMPSNFLSLFLLTVALVSLPLKCGPCIQSTEAICKFASFREAASACGASICATQRTEETLPMGLCDLCGKATEQRGSPVLRLGSYRLGSTRFMQFYLCEDWGYLRPGISTRQQTLGLHDPCTSRRFLTGDLGLRSTCPKAACIHVQISFPPFSHVSMSFVAALTATGPQP